MLAVDVSNRNTNYWLTPIGPVPTTFQFLAELLEAAHIGYKDTTMYDEEDDGEGPKLNNDGTATIVKKTKKVPRIVRDWYVVIDKEQVHPHRLNTTGKYVIDEKRTVNACNGHRKFCMIVDYIRHMIERTRDRANVEMVLMIAIGKKTSYETASGGVIDFGPQVEKMRGMHWRNVNNHLADLGVHGYKTVNDPDDL